MVTILSYPQCVKLKTWYVARKKVGPICRLLVYTMPRGRTRYLYYALAVHQSNMIPKCASRKRANIYFCSSRGFLQNFCDLVGLDWRYLVCKAKEDINTLRPKHNGRHFADDLFKCIFLNENVWIPIKISLEFVPKGPINYIPTLVQMMA